MLREKYRLPPISPGPLAQHNHAYGHTENFRIENDTPMLNVLQIVFKLMFCICCGRTILVTNLCPTGNARFEIMSYVIARDHLVELFHKYRTFGPRSDHTHFAAYH